MYETFNYSKKPQNIIINSNDEIHFGIFNYCGYKRWSSDLVESYLFALLHVQQFLYSGKIRNTGEARSSDNIHMRLARTYYRNSP